MNNITPFTRNIIIINLILFAVTELAVPSMKWLLSAYMPTSPHFELWQVITHMFVHGGLMHLAFNMFTLWNFGPMLEWNLGKQKFLILYFLSGLGAFILYNFWNYYQVYELAQILFHEGADIREVYLNAKNYGISAPFPQESMAAYELRSYLSIPMLGASGAIFGVVAGFCTLFPNVQMYMMFIPIPIKAKYLMPIVILISAFMGYKQFEWDNVAHFAHIGGALVGWILVRNWKKNINRII